MNKKIILTLLVTLLVLTATYTLSFTSLITGNTIKMDCQEPNNLDQYDCQLFEEELTKLCGEEFFKAGCNKDETKA